ncbi:Anthranilate synthase component I-related protein [Trichomonas vaginalis G3]|uniref:Anthranilate synthase component I-related protein n=1 Tax=Trichomonas vaginalis (strain ATCC PRA-98 / G3) TaxID=412133 RepID=A2DZU2_TRIV3|nr:glutamine metabolic process [Trichomonas vaginalis G3]EAY14001.1 Anthranilate synthase component I-related protein [Trichomonas vaginalis G3]KAI5519565.1 glutamine metabolic process [Trichomonas vaginalis G3]|eukprot:XP_001326224.1 Anthranilate synthase component I-related protein [Trichomonas vaginalis G3]
MDGSHEPLMGEETSNCKCQTKKPCANKPLMIMQILMLIVLLIVLGIAIFLLVNIDSSHNVDKNRRIRIGMAGMRLNETNTGDFNVSLYNYANLKYLDAIQKAGGTPMVLPVLTNLSIDLVEEQLDTIDALIIPGGYDVVPSLYGEETTKWIERTS